MQVNLTQKRNFESRHHGKTKEEEKAQLELIGCASVDELIEKTIPQSIRLAKPLELPEPLTEDAFLANFKKLASKNKLYHNYIGQGYYGTLTPNVILRNILENPGWYTAYTPYQAEIAQGRLEMLFYYQTMVAELTGMDMANASLLDEGTAAAEAMTMFFASKPREKKESEVFLIESSVFEQTKDVVIGRAVPIGIQVEVVEEGRIDLTRKDVFGILLQNPGKEGELKDYTHLIASAKENGIQVVVASDLLASVLIKPAGEMGADAVVGSAQRFGVPMGFGGPHAGFFAIKESYKRQIPGRIIGKSKDAEGNDAYRMALQTREQHIRREKATSNICTSQVLLAVISGAYGIYHGPEGLKEIAKRVYGLAQLFANSVQGLDFQIVHSSFFDTVTVAVEKESELRKIAEGKEINLFYSGNGKVSIAFDETKTIEDVERLLETFAELRGEDLLLNLKHEIALDIPNELLRETTFLSHPTYNSYQTEHEMLRYLKSLESKDLSLVHSMISLGSCTMKLNATTEMIPVTWPEFGGLHPFAPYTQTEGYAELFRNLKEWLCEITGFDAMSLQPNSGAQGEYSGLMVIRAYHHSRGDTHRNVAIIPSSAHGTNPASAVMAGMQVVVTKCDENGNVDLCDLKEKVEKHSENLSALMVTYPSTHGVFEEDIKEICALVHQHGGRVYMDGANMNAQVGLTSPASIGADVCHLNLHKTFCIPHGGGGPGMGPIGVVKDLAPFLPGHVYREKVDQKADSLGSIHAVSAAPWGSASILPISYAYIAMMGGEGLTNATKYAILNANYIKERLRGHYDILYVGKNGTCAHEMIVDCRPFKQQGIEVEDIAKRLMDYGFHAPTVSFPVAGTIMIEPTESESKQELDRFCDALISIREEIREIENGIADKENNVLVNAPHTMRVALEDNWTLPYSREKAVFPAQNLRFNKFWPSVSRIDSAYGDRNLVCTCEPISAYLEEEVNA